MLLIKFSLLFVFVVVFCGSAANVPALVEEMPFQTNQQPKLKDIAGFFDKKEIVALCQELMPTLSLPKNTLMDGPTIDEAFPPHNDFHQGLMEYKPTFPMPSSDSLKSSVIPPEFDTYSYYMYPVLLLSINLCVFGVLVTTLVMFFYWDRAQQSTEKDKIHDEEVKHLKEEIARLRKENSACISPLTSPSKATTPTTGLISHTDEPPPEVPSNLRNSPLVMPASVVETLQPKNQIVLVCKDTDMTTDTRGDWAPITDPGPSPDLPASTGDIDNISDYNVSRARQEENDKSVRSGSDSPIPMQEWWMNPTGSNFKKAAVIQKKRFAPTPPQSFYFTHFIHERPIGIGGCGAVFLAEHKTTGIKYAVKMMALSSRSRERILSEAAMHATLDHVNVVRYYSSWEDTLSSDELELIDARKSLTLSNASWEGEESSDTATATSVATSLVSEQPTRNYLFIQMHYYKEGTLRNWLDRRTKVDHLVNLRIFQQLVCGLLYLHQQGILHRDLKPGNIFLANQNMDVKIGDFGLSMLVRRNSVLTPEDPTAQGRMDEECTLGVGTPLYASPEQLRAGRVSEASDVFALGMVMLECYISSQTQSEKYYAFEAARKGWIPPEKFAVARDYKEEVRLILDMVRHDPQQRPPLCEVQKSVKRLTKKYTSPQPLPTPPPPPPQRPLLSLHHHVIPDASSGSALSSQENLTPPPMPCRVDAQRHTSQTPPLVEDSWHGN